MIGLAGLGFWGKNILRNLVELQCLELACDSAPELLKLRSQEFPEVRFTNRFEDLLRSPSIHGIAIATPAATHFELARQALLADKDVFVEKPLALSVKDGQELVSLAKARGRILMVGHLLQYHPAVTALKKLVDQGTLGDLRYIASHRLNLGRIRTEENILWSFAPHDISVMLMLLGAEPIKISAFGGAYLREGIHDTTLTNLQFQNGAQGHIYVSWIHPYKDHKLVVVGSRAMAVFDDTAEHKLCLYPHIITQENGVPTIHKAEAQPITIDDTEPLQQELSHFLECMQTRCSPRTDGEEGLRVLRVLGAAQQSLQTGSVQS